MKANSVFAGFLTCPPGRHRAFNVWHDEDHRPENVAQIEHVYHSARYVAEPRHIAERRVLDDGLVQPVGEYFAMYWSTEPPERLLYDMTVVRERLRLLGRCDEINRDFRATWRDRFHVVKARVPSDSTLTPDAVPLAPHAGIVVTLGELPGDVARWARRHDDEFVPRLLADTSVAAEFRFMPLAEADHHLFLHVWFTRDDPLVAQAHGDALERETGHTDATIHVRAGYRPTITGAYDVHI